MKQRLNRHSSFSTKRAEELTNGWHWTLRQARIHPWISGASVFALLMASSLGFGWWMRVWEESLVKWLDNAFIVLGGFSLTIGWAIALVVRAQRKEAALVFLHAGRIDTLPRFAGALILSSQSEALMEWHLRHLAHKRVEFVWTEKTRDSTRNVLSRFPEVECLRGPDRAMDRLADPFDLAAVRAHCQRLLGEMLVGYPPEQVCVDLTGGTAVMSVAMFQVAEELGVTSVYLMGRHAPAPGAAPQIRGEKVHDPFEGQVVILSDHRRETPEIA